MRPLRTESNTDTVEPVLSDHIQQDIVLAFQTGGCILLHGSSTAISNHLSIAISMSPD